MNTETTAIQPVTLMAPVKELSTSTDFKEAKKVLKTLKVDSKDEAIQILKFFTIFGNKDVMDNLKKEANQMLNTTIEGDSLELDGGLKIAKIMKEVKTFTQKSQRYEELETELAQAKQSVTYLSGQLKAEEVAPGMVINSTQEFSYCKLT